ncbi:MAG: FkbM family methyltransferase [Luteolibacter sp.]|uniref:FkbM family methyltransferase n=1 Tax=Luteolibacter sp. TaxID=1962973 RepID=UPI0032661C22
MEEHLRAGDCFFDIGAHVGEYSLIAAAAVGSTGSIIALEPQKDLCEIIMRNFEDNQIPNTRVIHGALGERCGRCHLFTDENTKGAVLEINSALADIPMYDLATLLKDIPADKRIWMKLDAAGYELPCLSACAEILRERPVHLILKAYSEEQVQNRFPGISQSLAEFLNSMGYRSFRITGDTPTPWDGVVHGYCEAIICESAGLTENRTQPGS